MATWRFWYRIKAAVSFFEKLDFGGCVKCTLFSEHGGIGGIPPCCFIYAYSKSAAGRYVSMAAYFNPPKTKNIAFAGFARLKFVPVR